MASDPSAKRERGKKMEYLVPLGIFLGWIILQAWVLPRMGVGT
jgi:hypothetical protein